MNWKAFFLTIVLCLIIAITIFGLVQLLLYLDTVFGKPIGIVTLISLGVLTASTCVGMECKE